MHFFFSLIIQIHLLSLSFSLVHDSLNHAVRCSQSCYAHFTLMYRIRRKRMEWSFSSIDQWWTLFRSWLVLAHRSSVCHWLINEKLPSNSVHRCELSIFNLILLWLHICSKILTCSYLICSKFCSVPIVSMISRGPWFEHSPWSWSITFSAARNWIASWWSRSNVVMRVVLPECQNNASSLARLSLNHRLLLYVWLLGWLV